MPKRSNKKPVVDSIDLPPTVTDSTEPGASPSADSEPTPNGKNPAAVALGRLGGKKGGPARAAKLTKKQLSEIGKKAAAARWGKKKD
jgi:hypothetical protein